MNKFREFISKFNKGWKGLSKSKKISVGILLSSLVIAALIYYLTIGRVKYVPIFTNLDIQDSGQIVDSLEEMNITKYKIEDGGSTILVSDKEVDKLRLDLAIDGIIPNSGNGFELFDETSFAITDEDRKILYQRALEGELQRSIMTLQEIDSARVHLAMSEETIFTKEVQPGTASIILKVNSLKKLNQEQIRGITSLVSAAVNNLPEENVKVIDSQGNLLSEALLNKDGFFQSSNNPNQRMEIEQEFENGLEKDLTNMLEQVLGIGKVLVKINAQLDLDSQESTIISYDKEGVIRSQQIQINGEGDMIEGIGNSPIDNNTQNYIDQNVENILEADGINSYNSITNNEVGETTTYTVKAPGEVKRITTSIVYNGTLTPEMQGAIGNIVESATGFNAERGDMINVEGIAFDTTYQDQIQQEMEREQALLAEQEAARQKLLMYVGIPVGIILAVLLIVGIIMLSRRKRREDEIQLAGTGINQSIPLQEVVQEPTPIINLNSEESTEERSIKDYAHKHPEKMTELLRAWIIEDER
jgi:flagellar M-ring protein FliF